MISFGLSLPSSGANCGARFPLVARNQCPISRQPAEASVVDVRCATGNGGVLKSKGPTIVELPLNEIRRPLLRTRKNDPEKVEALMESIAEIGLQEPIDILEVEGVFYGLKRTKGWACLPFAVKFGEEQKRL